MLFLITFSLNFFKSIDRITFFLPNKFSHHVPIREYLNASRNLLQLYISAPVLPASFSSFVFFSPSTNCGIENEKDASKKITTFLSKIFRRVAEYSTR